MIWYEMISDTLSKQNIDDIHDMNIYSWSQATAPRMQQQPVARAPRGIWRQATA